MSWGSPKRRSPNWVREDRQRRGERADPATVDIKTVRKLEKENAELRMERDVLKVRREALCRISDRVGRDLKEVSLGLMTDLEPKGARDHSMSANWWSKGRLESSVPPSPNADANSFGARVRQQRPGRPLGWCRVIGWTSNKRGGCGPAHAGSAKPGLSIIEVHRDFWVPDDVTAC
jgi:hypothetical protein